MAGVRFTTLQSRPREFLDFTSLNLLSAATMIPLICCYSKSF
jgi:hypothetical protein